MQTLNFCTVSPTNPLPQIRNLNFEILQLLLSLWVAFSGAQELLLDGAGTLLGSRVQALDHPLHCVLVGADLIL